jgi:heptosyltransferase III
VVSCLYDPDGYFAGNLQAAGVRTLVSCPYRPDETPPHVSAAAQFARPLESLGLFLADPALALDYGSARCGDGGGRDRFLVAIHPGSGSPEKNWSFESWAEVLAELHEREDATEFLVTSGEAEKAIIGDFLAMLDSAGLPYRHLHGPGLVELAAAYAEADCFLGHDSGISHLAASVGVPGLLLYGPTNPGVWAPSSPRMKTLSSPDGSMSGIRVADVLEAIGREGYSRRSRRV